MQNQLASGKDHHSIWMINSCPSILLFPPGVASLRFAVRPMRTSFGAG
jgi:hypothetical protein